MVIGTGKELVSFAERHGAIISQHIWEALTDLDKCAPKSAVENCHSLQQLKAEICHCVDETPQHAIKKLIEMGHPFCSRCGGKLSAV